MIIARLRNGDGGDGHSGVRTAAPEEETCPMPGSSSKSAETFSNLKKTKNKKILLKGVQNSGERNGRPGTTLAVCGFGHPTPSSQIKGAVTCWRRGLRMQPGEREPHTRGEPAAHGCCLHPRSSRDGTREERRLLP